MALIAILFFFGLSAAVIAKIKGSSFFIWFLIGFCLPFVGTLAAILWRFERDSPRRRCERCGAVVALHDQVCMQCGTDLDFLEPERPPLHALGGNDQGDGPLADGGKAPRAEKTRW